MRITVLSPHRDDAAFSLSLSIASWLEDGHEVCVLNCFTESEYAPYAHTIPKDRFDRLKVITALRRSEDERWGRACGVSLQTKDLGLKDAPLRLRCSSDVVCDLPVLPSDPALKLISQTLGEISYDALVLPLALGGHVDHLTARDGSSPMGKSSRCAFYEDLPYATRPGVFNSIARVACEIDPELRPVFSSATVKDVEFVLGRKKNLAFCYDSQIGEAESVEIAEYNRRFEGRERLWANAAWRQSELTFFEDAGF